MNHKVVYNIQSYVLSLFATIPIPKIKVVTVVLIYRDNDNFEVLGKSFSA